MKLPRVYVAVVSLVVVGVAGGVAVRLRPGTIAVTSQPAGATVALDGKATSQVTPCTLTGVRPGKHEVSCSLKDYHDGRARTEVRAGGSHSVSVELKPVLTTGFLQLESEPGGAAVWVDGEDSGRQTPATLDGIEPGEHSVELRQGGFKTWQQQFSIRAEETATLGATLEKLPEFALALKYEAETRQFALFAVNVADGSQRKVAMVPYWSHASAVSPDGRRIAVAACPSGLDSKRQGLTIIDYRGAVIRRASIVELCKGRLAWKILEPCLAGLQWHPGNSDRLLVDIGYCYNSALGLDQRLIAEYDAAHDRLRILTPLCKERIPGPSDTILDSNSGPLREFPAYEDKGATYSPDGKRVAFLRNGEVYVAGRDLSAPQLISQEIETGNDPFQPPLRWSPDGQRILCCRQEEGTIIQPDGTVVGTIPGLRPGASWTRDGQRVVGFRRGEGAPAEGTLCVYDVAGGQWTDLAGGFDYVGGAEHGPSVAVGGLAEPSKEPSKLTVVSKVGQAKVYLNGQLTGKLTPHTFTLDPGIYTVEIRTVDGQRTGKGSVMVLPGGAQTFTFN